MNRLQPCENCGCPVLYHVPRPVEGGGVAMVCAECSRTAGRDVVCRTEGGEGAVQRR